jgi:hypothetical protein
MTQTRDIRPRNNRPSHQVSFAMTPDCLVSDAKETYDGPNTVALLEPTKYPDEIFDPVRDGAWLYCFMRVAL